MGNLYADLYRRNGGCHNRVQIDDHHMSTLAVIYWSSRRNKIGGHIKSNLFHLLRGYLKLH